MIESKLIQIFDKSESKITVIAEIGNNHEGSIEKAKELILMAKESGATAAKLQLYSPSKFVSKTLNSRYEQICKYSLDEDSFIELFEFSVKNKFELFASAITEDWVNKLSPYVSTIKISSGDINFFPTVDACIKNDFNIIFSNGGSTFQDINEFVSYVSKFENYSKGNKIAMLHCVSSYPPPLKEANLGAFVPYRKNFDFPIGFSNHFVDDAPMYAALALGAKIFEIHITDDRKRETFRDHHISRTSAELKNIINNLVELSISLEKESKMVQKTEESSIALMRKGLIAAKFVSKNTTLTREDFAFARPATDFSWADLDSLIGQKISVDLEAGELFKKSHFK